VEVLFGGRAFSRVEIDLGKYPESIVLGKDARDCEAACIRLHNDVFLWVEMLEDLCFGKGLVDFSNCTSDECHSLDLRLRRQLRHT